MEFISRRDKAHIQYMVFDMTIGAGTDEDLRQTHFDVIECSLGRELSEEERGFIRAEWAECLQCMSSP